MTILRFEDSLYQYASRMSSEETAILKALERDTYLKVLKPVMLSGHLQGLLLQMLCSLTKARRVLEIGTFTGYSAICLAQGVLEDGLVHTIEIDEELFEDAKERFENSPLADKIIAHLGNAAEIIPQINELWDLVFIDADKTNYALYYDLCMPQLNSGGLIIVDNVLFEGRVLNPVEQQGKNEKALHLFNQKIKQDTRVEVLMLPIRDGISLIRKK